MAVLSSFLLLGAIAASLPGGVSTMSFTTPATGSVERQVVLDAARGPVTKELGKKVEFAVKELRVGGGWAFLLASMQGTGGQRLDYSGTPFQDAAERGQKSDDYAALLRKRGEQWEIVAYSIGPTDMAWAPWPDAYHAPAALFGFDTSGM